MASATADHQDCVGFFHPNGMTAFDPDFLRGGQYPEAKLMVVPGKGYGFTGAARRQAMERKWVFFYQP